MQATRESLLDLAGKALKYDTLEVKSWNMHVRVRSVLALTRAICLETAKRADGVVDQRRLFGMFCVYGMVDDKGNPICGTDDLEAVLSLPEEGLNEVGQRILTLSGMQGAGDANSETAEKNFESTPT